MRGSRPSPFDSLFFFFGLFTVSSLSPIFLLLSSLPLRDPPPFSFRTCLLYVWVRVGVLHKQRTHVTRMLTSWFAFAFFPLPVLPPSLSLLPLPMYLPTHASVRSVLVREGVCASTFPPSPFLFFLVASSPCLSARACLKKKRLRDRPLLGCVLRRCLLSSRSLCARTSPFPVFISPLLVWYLPSSSLCR